MCTISQIPLEPNSLDLDWNPSFCILKLDITMKWNIFMDLFEFKFVVFIEKNYDISLFKVNLKLIQKWVWKIDLRVLEIQILQKPLSKFLKYFFEVEDWIFSNEGVLRKICI